MKQMTQKKTQFLIPMQTKRHKYNQDTLTQIHSIYLWYKASGHLVQYCTVQLICVKDYMLFVR